MKIKVNSNYSSVDEIISSIENSLFKNGFETKNENSKIVFYRKTDKSFNRLMPLIEVTKGINEGKLIVREENDKVIIDCQFRWFLHSFTTILLLVAFFLIFFAANDFKYALNKLVIISVIILPLSFTGIIISLKHFKNIIIKAIRQTGIDNTLIESN